MTGIPSVLGSAEMGTSRLLILRTEAESDIQTSYRWYEQQRSGLGSEFLDALDQAISGIERLPEQHPIVYKEVRRVLLKRFPYAVFYIHEPLRTVILAVIHQRREPSRWQGRL